MMGRTGLAFLLLFSVQLSLGAQSSSLARPNDLNYKPPPFLDKKKFQDLLPEGAVLGFQKDGRVTPQTLKKIAVLQGTGFERRYLERRWQELDEEGEDIVLLEQALLDQFGSSGFSDELAYHPYHESSTRRFQIVFLLSLPISFVYAYALVGVFKVFLSSASSEFMATETGAALTLGLGLSGAIGYHDYKRSQEYNQSYKNGENKLEFWKQKW